MSSVYAPQHTLISQLNSCGQREEQRALYARFCDSLGKQFRGIFLFSAEGSLEFRNTSLDDGNIPEPKVGHWDYVDAGFLEEPEVCEDNKELLKELKSYGIKNPEMLPKNGDYYWIRGYEKLSDRQWLQRVTKRSQSIRFIRWWIGTPKPHTIQYGEYDVGYAESSQCEPEITCKELINLVKLGGYIIMRQSTFDSKIISHPLQTQYRGKVQQLVESMPNGFDLFQKIG